ncbi:MAG: DUF418 domain-containing protein [Niabella sp.]
MDKIRPINKERFPQLDALRGYAVLSIILFHFVQHLNYPVYPEPTSSFLSKTDSFFEKTVHWLWFGKVYSIFTILFGLSFHLQQSVKKFASNFDIWFSKRMVVLFLIGCLNAVFFPDGDILVLYSLVGLLMILLNKLSTKILIILAAFLLTQPIELFQVVMIKYANGHGPVYYSDVLKFHVNQVIAQGDIYKIAWTNFTYGQVASLLWAHESGRVSQIIGLFIIGIVAGRTGFIIRNIYNQGIWQKLAVLCLILLTGVYYAKHGLLALENGQPLKDSLSVLFGLWQNFIFTCFSISIFFVLCNTPARKILYTLLVPVGRMSLTNYVLQSVIGAFIFFPFGLNLAEKVGITGSLLIGVAVSFILWLFSKSWISNKKQGPIEYIWRKLVWWNNPAKPILAG